MHPQMTTTLPLSVGGIDTSEARCIFFGLQDAGRALLLPPSGAKVEDHLSPSKADLSNSLHRLCAGRSVR